MSSSVPSPAGVLEVVDGLGPPGTPLTTPEVAAKFECTDRTVYNKLETLVEDGELETKKVGARGRVWWRQPADPPTTGTQGLTERRHTEAERELLFQTTRSITQSATFDEGLQAALRDIWEATDWAYAEAWIPTEEGKLRRAAADCYSDDLAEFAEFSEVHTFAHGEGLPGRVWASGEFEWAANLPTGLRGEFPRLDKALSVGLNSALGVPVVADDEVMVVLTFLMREAREIDNRLVNQVSSVAAELGELISRRRVEKRLKRERDLVERVLETIPVGIGVLSSDGEIVRANKRAAEILGIVEDDPETDAYVAGERRIYDPDGDPVPPQDRPYAQVFETSEPVLDWQCQIENPDGEERWLSVNATPLTDEDGEVEWVVTSGEDITQVKEQARRLERQRDDLKTELDEVFDRVSDGFLGLDTQLRFTHVNERAADLLERTAGELVGERIWNAFEPGPKAKAAFDEALATQEPVSFEEYYEPLDTWFENHVYPSESGLSVYFRDITERKRRERELRRYKTTIETVWDGVGVLDGNDRFTMVNQAFCDIAGYDREELLGEHVTRIHSDAVNEKAEELNEAVIDGGLHVATLEFDLQTADGESIPVEGRFGPFELEDGSIGRAGVIRDISERKRRERNLERYKRIVETVRDGVYAVDSDDRFVLVNQAFCDLVGYDRETLLGAHPTLIKSQAVNDAANELQAEVQGGERDVGVIEFEFETATGETVPIEGRIAPFEYADGRLGRCGVVRDVTERLEYERKLESQREQLSALNDIHSVVLSVITQVVEQSTIDELAKKMCDEFADSEIYASAWMGRVSRNGRELTVTASSERDGRLADVTIPLSREGSAEEGPIARAVRTGSIQISEHIFDDRTADEWPLERRYRDFTGLVVPLQYEGRIHGVLTLYTDRPENIDDFERELIQDLGEVVGHVISAIEREQALVAEQAIEVEYRSEALAAPFVAVAEDDVHITYDRAIPLRNGGTLQYHTIRELTPEKYRDILREFPIVSDFRVLSTEGETSRVEIRTTDDSTTSLVTSHHGRVKTTTIKDGELRIVAELPVTANLREFTEELQELYPDMELAGHQTETPQRMSLAEYKTEIDDSLTDRQHSALESAFASGYFEWPRITTAEELADLHDVHPSTFHRHLRRAEQKLVSTVFHATV